jgi:hypothetical protein
MKSRSREDVAFRTVSFPGAARPLTPDPSPRGGEGDRRKGEARPSIPLARPGWLKDEGSQENAGLSR